MRNVLRSMRLDYYILKASYKTFFPVIYLLVIFFGIMTHSDIVIGIAIIFSAVFCGIYYSVYEKYNLNRLYGILPVGRFEVILGKYVYALLFGILNEIISGLFTVIISLFINKGVDQLELSAYLSLSLLYFCLAISISFPVYLKYGYSKSYIFTMLPLFLVFICAIFFSRSPNAGAIIEYFANNLSAIWLVGIGGGLTLLAVSFYVSWLIYRKQAL